MTRPMYETPEDLAKQAEVAEYIAKKWQCEMQILPKAWPIDYCGKRHGKVLSFIEIKCRDNYSYANLDGMGGLMVDLRKLVALREFCRESLLPGFICIRTSSGHFFYKDEGLRGFQVVWGGRRDRGDVSDMEPCVLIPMELFKPL